MEASSRVAPLSVTLLTVTTTVRDGDGAPPVKRRRHQPCLGARTAGEKAAEGPRANGGS